LKRLRFALIATLALSAAGFSTAASAGCARWGETGYHYYRSCFGPAFLYPHHRRCDRGTGFCLYH
jgi:hypothetical protein